MQDWNAFCLYRKKNLYYFQFFSLFSNMLLLVLPIYTLQIYNRVLSSQSTDTLIYLVIIALMLIGVQVFMDYTRQQVLNNIALLFDSVFDTKSVRRSASVSLIDKGQTQSAYLDHNQAKQYLASPFHRSLADLPWTALFIIVMYMLSPTLGSYALVSTIILIIASGLMLFLSRENASRVKNLTARQGMSLQQLLGRGKHVKSHLIAERVIGRWKQRNDHLLQEEMASKLLSNKGQSALKLLRMFVQVGVFAVGAWLVIEQEIMAGSLLAASILLGRILAPIDQGANHYFSWKESKQAYERISGMHSNEASKPKLNVPLDVIEFAADNLSYRAPVTDKTLLKSISFTLKPGNCILIQGEAGSGKSTLLKLFSNTLRPTEGSVKLNGIDLDKIGSENFLKSVSYLPQSAEVFSASVVDNISGFDHGDHVVPGVLKASKAAGCHKFISTLPDNYSTKVGVDGVELSASEAQRLALANCFYGSPKLLILDEPTSFLDTNTKKSVKQHLTELKQAGTSIIFVSSDPALQELADYVVGLKNGMIFEAFENKKPQREDKVRKLTQHIKY